MRKKGRKAYGFILIVEAIVGFVAGTSILFMGVIPLALGVYIVSIIPLYRGVKRLFGKPKEGEEL